MSLLRFIAEKTCFWTSHHSRPNPFSRSFTPTPGGLEFHPGKDYYFISTSSRSDLYRRIGGRCSSHNMRVVFKVADNPVESSSAGGGKGSPDVVAVNVPRRAPPSVDRKPDLLNVDRKSDLLNVDRKSDLLNVDNDRIGSDFPSYLYPLRDVIELDSNSVDHEKRSEDDDRRANEVVKQASIMTSSCRRLVSSMHAVLAAVSIAIAVAVWT
jgi:ephrin-B